VKVLFRSNTGDNAMSWFTVKESKIVFAPITATKKNGDPTTRFIKIGVKVEMADGSWWFYSFKHASWTKHNTLVRKMDKLGRPAVEGGKPVFLPERKDRYTGTSLHREWGSRKPELIRALSSAVESATADVS